MKLAGKTAIVTGGARGIGAAIVEAYVAEGATVAIADLAKEDGEKLAAKLGAKAFFVTLDVTNRQSIDVMVKAVVAKAGGIDILVNNAAVFDLAPIVEVSEKSWDSLFDVNVKGLFFTLQAVAQQMIAQGRGGKIVNMASQAGRRGEALVSVYCATKASVISLTQSAGLDLIKYRINVNGIAPGVVDTPMWGEVDALFLLTEVFPRHPDWAEKRGPGATNVPIVVDGVLVEPGDIALLRGLRRSGVHDRPLPLPAQPRIWMSRPLMTALLPISTPEQALLAAGEADLVIVGSALIRAKEEGRLNEFLSNLRAGFEARELVAAG